MNGERLANKQANPNGKNYRQGGYLKEEPGLENYIFGKIQPQAIPLEEAVLGALMLDRDALPMIIEVLKPESFYLESHQHIYRAILHLFNTNSPVDLLTVTEAMRVSKTIDLVGGGYYLVELSHRVASAANIEYHARIIQQKHIQRQLIQFGTKTIRDAYEDVEDVFKILDNAEAEMMAIQDFQVGQEKNTVQLGKDVLKDLELRASQKGLVGVPYGIVDIDRKTGGFHKTDLVIIAGRPGMGKTGFALSLALNAAMEFNNPVGFFSLEMSGEQLHKRMVSMVAEVDGEKMRTGELEDFEWQKIGSAIERLNSVQIFIDDTPAISILELRAKARRMKRQYGIKALFIDYLQLLTVGNEEQKGRNREQEISYISRSLKSLAKQLDIPIIALAQLSRAVEIRGGSKRPQLSDLRESGSIESDADVIQFIYRAEYYKILEDEQGRSLRGIAEIITAKNRHGALFMTPVQFDAVYTRFAELPFDSAFVAGQSQASIKFPTTSPNPNVFHEPERMNEEDIPF